MDYSVEQRQFADVIKNHRGQFLAVYFPGRVQDRPAKAGRNPFFHGVGFEQAVDNIVRIDHLAAKFRKFGCNGAFARRDTAQYAYNGFLADVVHSRISLTGLSQSVKLCPVNGLSKPESGCQGLKSHFKIETQRRCTFL